MDGGKIKVRIEFDTFASANMVKIYHDGKLQKEVSGLVLVMNPSNLPCYVVNYGGEILIHPEDLKVLKDIFKEVIKNPSKRSP